jgi:predicted AlkP superfamily pyrophosphatase or phosphodiesterase
MSDKLIVLMVDGVAAEHYAADRARFPHFAALEARGFRVENLRSEALGTSLPGRTSMLTGVRADVSGVYGNKIWGGDDFRYATPDDIRVPTIPARAKAAGQEVAVLGFGMVRPEDADIFMAPWWVGEFVQRARDAAPTPADESWLRVGTHRPGERFERMCSAAGVPATLPSIETASEAQRWFFGVMADQMIADWVGVLASSPDAPDLIIAEFLITDTIQHYTGYKSEFSQWSVAQADQAVGKIMQRLRAAGVEDEWNIAVMSDHGHSPIETALHPGVIIPGVRVQCEGGSLLVAPRDAAELEDVTKKLAPFGVEPFPNDCIPAELRDQVHVFVAPERVSFENEIENATEPVVAPKAISSHGLRPGLPGDDRFALFAGPRVPHGSAQYADAVQVAPTFAALLGLEPDGLPADSIFQPR